MWPQFFINYSFLIRPNLLSIKQCYQINKSNIFFVEQLTLLIPANKESESLPIFLNELKKFDYKILVVLQKEDLETINSITTFNNIKILKQKNNGYGNALKEGIEEIETEFFCIINADGSMDPKYLEQMLNDCKKEDFVFASRYLRKRK